jgi:tRNA-dihydrouridine synthase B
VLCKRQGADLVYTEFVNARELVHGNPRMRRKLLFLEEERPVGIQIYGGEPDEMAEAARVATSFRPDLLDINCGCWVKDVAGRGAGAGLLRDLSRMEKLIAAVVQATSLPVTVKTRLGWDADSIRIVEVARMCEANGVAALTVHCRTRDQGHTGEVDYDWIPRIKDAVDIPVIVNGNVTTPEEVAGVFEQTRCDAVMIGRAALRNPHIFRQAKHFLATGTSLPELSPEERLDLLRQHFELAVRHLGERDAVVELRRHYAILLIGMRDVQELRDELRRATEPGVILDHIARRLDLFTPTR